MRQFPAILTLALGMAAAAPALGQIQPEVTMNPNAAGTKVLLYPGGQYGRVQKELLQPGEADPNMPVLLHMPRKHPVQRTAKPAAPTPKTEVAAAPPPRRRTQPQPQETAPFSDIPKESAASLLMQEAAKPAKPKPAPARPAPAKPVVAAKPPPPKPQPQQDATFNFLSGNQQAQSAPPPAAPAPTRTASIDAAGTTPGKRNTIIFAPGAEEPPVSVVDTIRGLSASLNAALSGGAAQIRIEAFGGKQNDKSSDARRLSLKRALIVRQLLIDDGIPSERIVVQAMGGAPSGALDRVDILVAS